VCVRTYMYYVYCACMRVWHKIMIYFRYKLYCGSAPLRPTRRGWHLWFLPPGFPVNITSGLVQEQLVVPNLEVPSEARFQGIRESLPKKCCLMRPYTHATVLSVWDLKPPLIGDGITVSPCLGWRWRRSLGMEGEEIETGSWEESEIPKYLHQQAVPCCTCKNLNESSAVHLMFKVCKCQSKLYSMTYDLHGT
jgi:hypothetical protein